MDMGIAGRTALVCAASKGLGRGCAEALAAEGVNLVIIARTAETLEATAARHPHAIAASNVKTVACDITTPEGHAAALAACPQPDILVNNAGGPPPGDFRNFTHDDWITRARKQHADADRADQARPSTAMIERGFGRIVNITSSSVKAPIDVLGLSNGARSGLTGFVAGVARKVAPTGVTINNLLPGTVRHRPHRRDVRGAGQGAKHLDRRRARAARADDCPPAASARRTNSAARARSCAACMRATSPGRTC